jgi:Zn-dependent protease
MPTDKGAFKIFTLAGIAVYVHWSWFLVAIYSIQYRTHQYSFVGWNAAEYLSLFLIVLMHEFGHQLACRQVGGETRDIVLWPLGGVAYVNPPQRPGAQLWSIAAGPLVNVALVPVLAALWSAGYHLGWSDSHRDLYQLLHNIWVINLVLLIFNMMPVYPLDGGQILRSLLWFVVGRANSLFYRCGWVDRSGDLAAVNLAGHHGRVHSDELLGRSAAGAGIVADRQASPPCGLCLSILPDRATAG